MTPSPRVPHARRDAAGAAVTVGRPAPPRGPRHRGGAAGVVVRLVALVTGVLLALTTALPAAEARTETPRTPLPASPSHPRGPSSPASGEEVEITLTSVRPSSPSPTDPVTIEGTVRNLTDRPMSWVQVSFWRSRDPLTDTADLGHLLSSPATVPTGERWFHEPDEGSLDNVTDVDGKTRFAPGQSAHFRVTGTPRLMGLASPDTVAVVGVHVQATPQGQSRHTVGRSRVLTVLAGPRTTAHLTPVVVLTSAPSMRVDGTFVDDHLATDLSGRLTTLVEAAEKDNLSVLVDPALVDQARAMAKGYAVETSGRTVPGTGQQAAKAWLDALTPLLTSGRAMRLPWADADVVSAAVQGRTEALERTAAALPPDNPAASLPLAVLDSRGVLTTKAWHLIARTLRPGTVLTASAPASRGVLTDRGATIVPLTSGLFDGGPGPDPRTTAPQVRGRLLAQTLLASRASQPVVSPVTSGAQLDALTPPGWLGLDDLTRLRPGDAAVSLTPQADPTLGSQWWKNHQRTCTDVDDWSALLGTDHEAATRLCDQLLSADLSLELAEERRTRWLATALAPARRALSGDALTLHSAPTFVMSSSSNEFPISVTNHLAEPVRVKVVTTSQNPQRIRIPDTPVVTVRPNETQTIKVTPRASSNGLVEMSSRLATASGRPLGQPRDFVVKATRMDDVGWVIIVVSGAVVIGATLLRVHQVRKRGGPRTRMPPRRPS